MTPQQFSYVYFGVPAFLQYKVIRSELNTRSYPVGGIEVQVIRLLTVTQFLC